MKNLLFPIVFIISICLSYCIGRQVFTDHAIRQQAHIDNLVSQINLLNMKVETQYEEIISCGEMGYIKHMPRLVLHRFQGNYYVRDYEDRLIRCQSKSEAIDVLIATIK